MQSVIISALAIAFAFAYGALSLTRTTSLQVELFDGPWKIEPWIRFSYDISFGKATFTMVRAGYVKRDYNLQELSVIRGLRDDLKAQPKVDFRRVVQVYDERRRQIAFHRIIPNLWTFRFFHQPISFQESAQSRVRYTTQIVMPIWPLIVAGLIALSLTVRKFRGLIPRESFAVIVPEGGMPNGYTAHFGGIESRTKRSH